MSRTMGAIIFALGVIVGIAAGAMWLISHFHVWRVAIVVTAIILVISFAGHKLLQQLDV